MTRIPIGGYSKNYGLISGRNYVGGILGYDEKSSNNNENYGNVIGEDYVGGIVGKTDLYAGIYEATVDTSINEGSIQGINYVGGIVGQAHSTFVKNSKSTGVISGISYVGGIVGDSDSIWGKGAIINSFYLKTENINSGIYGIGNLSYDIVGSFEGKDESFFD